MVAPFLTCPIMTGPVTRTFTAEVFEVVYYEEYDTSSILTVGNGHYGLLGDVRSIVSPGGTYRFTFELQRGGVWEILELEEIY
jgi:hypothetical protein